MLNSYDYLNGIFTLMGIIFGFVYIIIYNVTFIFSRGLLFTHTYFQFV